MASGGVNNLIVWSLQDLNSSCSVVKHYQQKNGIAMSNSDSNMCVSEVHWSHDGNLLAAAIHDYIAVFDLRKFGKALMQVGGGANASGGGGSSSTS